MSSRLPAGLEDLPTPAYVYDLDQVDHAYALLRQALPTPSTLYYSLKANPHPAIVGALRQAGCRAEVCSPGELRVALDAGHSPDEILYTGPGKRDVDVADAMRHGVTWFSVDSPHGIDQLDRIAGAVGVGARFLLRVNDSTPVPGQGLTMTGVPSQFGADAEWILAEPTRFGSRDAATLAGFHLYMGSNLTDEDALVAQFGQAAATARKLADACGTEARVLDLGGGFGAPFARAGDLPTFPTLAERLADLLDTAFPGWGAETPEVAFESGRYLVATAGRLLTRVLDAKRSHGSPVLVLESGINHLGGMSGLRRLPPMIPHLHPTDDDRGEVSGTIVAGPLCTPLDTWARGVTATDARPGDLLVVPNVGAYGLAASLVAFLGHPLPAEVIVRNGQISDISTLTLRRAHVPDLDRE
ncbi:type III PLP-dependent enzyme [Solihabitans fulvus]|uniref:Type III PLP-dependent enzyme n=1 Tax=Solihabitans fulvus TaxID=1892852 RepID=A0A5B2WTI7_9PSEU|nr:type III PLP-dependent enzyme [Solihabitans fulvus]KAA2255363.1 type III PLP-dependent enzyme [Solihabitans fulvus]